MRVAVVLSASVGIAAGAVIPDDTSRIQAPRHASESAIRFRGIDLPQPRIAAAT